MTKPSKRQGEVLRYCAEFYTKNDQLPPRAMICRHFGWASWNAAEEMLQALESKGYLERNEVGKFRFTALARAYIANEQTMARWFPTKGSPEPTSGTVCATMPV